MGKSGLISQATAKALKDLLSQISSGQRALIDDASREILSEAIPLAKKRGKQTGFLKSAESIILHKISGLCQNDQKRFRRALIAKLALELAVVVDQMGLPENILELYPEAFGRLSDYLKNNKNDAYDLSDDFFRKDMCFVLGVSIPCGAQVVDLMSYFGYIRIPQKQKSCKFSRVARLPLISNVQIPKQI